MNKEIKRFGSGTVVDGLREYGIYLALVLLILFFSIQIPAFRTTSNALLVLLQVSVIGIIAVGMTMTIICAGIDLSVGALLAVASVMSGLFAQMEPTMGTMALAFIVPVVVGICGGAINGAIIAGANVNPLIVTLGTMTAFRGFVVWFRINPIYNLQPFFSWVGQGSLLGIPVPVLVFCAVAVAASVLLNLTRFGRYVYAVGGNREAARAAGVNVRLVIFSVYALSGLCVGIASLISTSRLMAAQATAGQGFELQAIAAAVIGGASLFGGRGRISNTVVGALIMGVLFNGFVMLGVPQPIQQVFVGAIIIAAVWADGVMRRKPV